MRRKTKYRDIMSQPSIIYQCNMVQYNVSQPEEEDPYITLYHIELTNKANTDILYKYMAYCSMLCCGMCSIVYDSMLDYAMILHYVRLVYHIMCYHIMAYYIIYTYIYFLFFILPHAVSASATAVHRGSLCRPASTREVKRRGGAVL